MAFYADELLRWAKDNLDVWFIKHEENCYLNKPYTNYMGYKKQWHSSANHLCTFLGLLKHDYGFWLIVGSCDAGYAANEDNWNKINLGTIIYIDEVVPIYNAMCLTAAREWNELPWIKDRAT